MKPHYKREPQSVMPAALCTLVVCAMGWSAFRFFVVFRMIFFQPGDVDCEMPRRPGDSFFECVLFAAESKPHLHDLPFLLSSQLGDLAAREHLPTCLTFSMSGLRCPSSVPRINGEQQLVAVPRKKAPVDGDPPRSWAFFRSTIRISALMHLEAQSVAS